MDQWILMEVVIWSAVDVEARGAEENRKGDNGVDSRSDNGAFTKSKVPNRVAKVIRQAKASLLPHLRDTSATAMYSIFGQEKENW